MPGSTHRPITLILEMVASGERTLGRLATGLKRHEGMYFIPSPTELADYLMRLNQLVERSRAKAEVEDVAGTLTPEPSVRAGYPRPLGLKDKEGGFLPCVFTSQKRAEEFAVEHQVTTGMGKVAVLCRPWASGLRSFLGLKYAGLSVDHDSVHNLKLSQASMGRLFAHLTLADFAALEKVYVVTLGRTVHVQRTWRDEIQVFAFDAAPAAQEGLAILKAKSDKVQVSPVPMEHFLASIKRINVGQLVVNPGVEGERHYDAKDIDKLTKAARGAEIDETTAQLKLDEESDPLRFEDTGVNIAVSSYGMAGAAADEVGAKRAVRATGTEQSIPSKPAASVPPTSSEDKGQKPAARPATAPRRGAQREVLGFSKKKKE